MVVIIPTQSQLQDLFSCFKLFLVAVFIMCRLSSSCAGPLANTMCIEVKMFF